MFIKILITLFMSFQIFNPINMKLSAESAEKTNNIYEELDVNSYTLTPEYYETGADEEFSYENAYLKKELIHGKGNIANLTINGHINGKAKYRNVDAFGVTDGLSLSIKQNHNLFPGDKDQWTLRDEKNRGTIGEIPLTDDMHHGVIIIQKSKDNFVYENAVQPLSDAFSESSVDYDDFYTLSGEDIFNGVFLKILNCYTIQKRLDRNIFHRNYDYCHIIEQYNFYISINTGKISIHNLNVNKNDLPEIDGIESSIIEKSETLVNNSVTTEGFKIDIGHSNYIVQVKHNEGSYVNAQSGDIFTQNGKYTIMVMTKLGLQKFTTIYVFDGGEDNGKNTYFKNGLIDGKRIFRQTDIPMYAAGASIKIDKIHNNLPSLYGYFKNLDTEEIYEIKDSRQVQKFDLGLGEYYCELTNSEPNTAGSFYKYTYRFILSNEKPNPYVNKNNFDNLIRLQDLKVKHYEVAYPMTQGGHLYVCFSLDSLDEAKKYAYEIEKRFIEKRPDGLYYKRPGNEHKIKYTNIFDLQNVLNSYASKNIEYAYFNSLDEFTYRTFDDNLLEELEKLNYKESYRVFPNENEKIKMLDKMSYLNNFTFIQAADFDCNKVEAYCYRNGKTYDIKFGIKIDNQLPITSKYKITETNVYGDKNEYDLFYLANNTTRVNLSIKNNREVTNKNIISDDFINGEYVINADSVKFNNIINENDSHSIITLKAPNIYSYEIKCLLSEFENIVLYKKGQYELNCIDRVGNSFTIKINLTGNDRFNNKDENSKSFSDLYNDIYMQDKDLKEENYLDDSKLIEQLSIVVNQNLFTKESYDNYFKEKENSQSVLNDYNSTQLDIDKAAKNLKDAYNELVYLSNKDKLLAYINEYESVNSSIYTEESFKRYTLAYDDALKVLNDTNSLDAEINRAIDNLLNAKENLVLYADKDILLKTINSANLIDLSLYTDNSREEFVKVLNKAIEIYNSEVSTPIEIQNITNSLSKSMDSLVLRTNFRRLGELINKIYSNQYNLNKNYTYSSLNDLLISYNSGCLILNNPDSSQETVDHIYNDLLYKYDSLEKPVNNSKLLELIDEIKKIDYYLYEEYSIVDLKLVYDEAIVKSKINLNEKELDDIYSKLLNAKDNIKINSYKKTLYEKLLQLKNSNFKGMSLTDKLMIEKLYNDGFDLLFSNGALDYELKLKIGSIEDILFSKKYIQTINTYFFKLPKHIYFENKFY